MSVSFQPSQVPLFPAAPGSKPSLSTVTGPVPIVPPSPDEELLLDEEDDDELLLDDDDDDELLLDEDEEADEVLLVEPPALDADEEDDDDEDAEAAPSFTWIGESLSGVAASGAVVAACSLPSTPRSPTPVSALHASSVPKAAVRTNAEVLLRLTALR